LGRRLTHVWGEEHPLWERVIGQIGVEHGEVLEFCGAIHIRSDRIIADEGAVLLLVPSLSQSHLIEHPLVFAHIIISTGLLIDVVAFKTTEGRILAINAPAHSFGLKEIDDGLGG
jgi:hypothetical protein